MSLPPPDAVAAPPPPRQRLPASRALAFVRARRRPLLLVLLVALVLGAGIEGWRWLAFYRDATAAEANLRPLERSLSIDVITRSPAEVVDLRQDLAEARSHLEAAQQHVDSDPLLLVARHLPFFGGPARDLATLVRATHATAAAAVPTLDALEAYVAAPATESSALKDAIDFLQRQRTTMAAARAGLERARALRAGIEGDPPGPLGSALADLDRALARYDSLLTGYERAQALLPTLLGFDRPRSYVVLAQNETERFPSGGLISNYGIVTFDRGRVASMRFEYFGTLFQRWQRETRGEYVAPPAPLKNYLLDETSWALGEAGWDPDFPTTARLARSFLAKGGVEDGADGTIAIDLASLEAILGVLGPVTVEGDTVTAANATELTLARTRTADSVPGAVGKDFLSELASEVVERLSTVPRDRWPALLRTLNRLGRERHLQLHFDDASMQALAREYGFDGALTNPPAGDTLLLADTSVASTKLNLILQNAVEVEVRLDDTTALTTVVYEIANPFPEWERGRDPRLVRALMLDGVYGAYLRLYAPQQARLEDVRLDGRPAGAEQAGIELGRLAVGRFASVPPGATRRIEFRYAVPDVVETLEDGSHRYRLQVQKQAGTRAVPLAVRLELPPGAVLRGVTLDGKPAGLTLETDLRTDRVIEVVYRPPR